LQKTVKRYESELDQLESATRRAGKKSASELSQTLHQLTAKLSDFDRVKRDRLGAVLTRDNNQHLTFIQSLQTLMRSEIECFTHVRFPFP
jgi:hypothetical protein